MTEAVRLDDLLTAARERGGAVLVEEDGRAFDADAFGRRVAACEAWLAREGLGAGDCVAVWLVNRLEWLALLFAAARRGVAVAAVNTRYRSSELHHILLSSGARLLVMQPDFGRIDFAGVVAEMDGADLPELERVAVLGEPGAERLLGRPVVAFDPDPGAADPPPPDRDGDPEAPLVFFTTSGTTSRPKLVTHTQRTLAMHARSCAAALGFDAPGAGFLAAMPLCGVFGLNAALAAIAGGAPVHLMHVFEAQAASRLIRQHRLTHLFGSDEMFRRLAELDRDGLRWARLCGYAIFTPGLGEAIRALAEGGLPLRGVYGSSEVNALFATQPEGLDLDERLRGGGLPVRADSEVRARDRETGRILGPGEVGDLEIRAATSFAGYHRNPEATAEAIDAEGFFRTGDVGYVRGDGSFVYLARGGDAIRLSGFLVDPAEIEEVLEDLPGVADSQVVGVEVEGRMRPVAFAIPEAGFDEAAVIEGARARLAHFKVPARVFPVDDFPATESANGRKIRKAELRAMAERMMGAEGRRSA
jgi:fatty-acyl-CoA synthase